MSRHAEVQIEELLKHGLQNSWNSRTSSDPTNWRPNNPGWGQCAVSACIVQDVLGGDIRWVEATTPDGRKYSHYFNLLPDGTVFDATRDQFPHGTIFSPDSGIPRTSGIDGVDFKTTREYILAFPATRRRYVLLKDIVRSTVDSQCKLEGLFESKNCENTSE